jgi:hypothetical protein
MVSIEGASFELEPLQKMHWHIDIIMPILMQNQYQVPGLSPRAPLGSKPGMVMTS